MAAPTVFLVDDDLSFLRSMARLLRASGFGVKTCSSAADFLAQDPPESPGCVVLDLQMPGMDGMELQEALARSGNPLPVVFLTGHGNIPTSVKAMRSGAEDFLTKLAAKEEILVAVQRALARDERERVERVRRQELSDRFARLTPREREVLMHVLRGRLNKQIAFELGINERSVKRHRTHIMAKIGIQSVAELACLAFKAGVSTEAPASYT